MKILLRVSLTLVLILAGIAAFLGWDAYHYLSQPLPVKHSRLIQVPRGMSLRALSQNLLAQGVIKKPRYALYWNGYGRLSGASHRLKAGEYQIRPGMSPVKLLHTITNGEVYQHSLTIIDGWTFKQMMAAVESDKALSHHLQGDTPKQVMAAIGHTGIPAEGRFLPNTYDFPRGMSDIKLLRQAYHAMDKFLGKAWHKRGAGLPLDNEAQALALASIIEKETAVPAERPRIAGVFVRRLRKGMRLQSDPTVIYGLGSSYHGNLHRSDLRRKTPYNTYTRSGLPPTPICMPDQASIHAALHPASGKALYFVSKGNGTHHFSATFAQHKRAVRKYQLHEDVQLAQ
jgi:UPF0755 protein